MARWALSASLSWLLIAVVVLRHHSALAIRLDGSPTSYAEYSSWWPSGDGSRQLQLQFRTRQPSGLLLYSDDGRDGLFVELKLVAGRLRLTHGDTGPRLRTSGGSRLLELGRGVNDGRWHSVRVLVARRDGGAVVRLTLDHHSAVSPAGSSALDVDEESTESLLRVSSSADAPADEDGRQTTARSPVYVGGVSRRRDIRSLALPSAAFEPRLAGQVRNLVFRSRDGVEKRQDLVSSKGVRWNTLDACSQMDPCQNGARCVSTDHGRWCRCTNTHFTGKYCHKETTQSQASFDGRQSLVYDLTLNGGTAVASVRDQLALSFRTSQSNVLLIRLDGQRGDFMGVHVVNGDCVELSSNVGGERLQLELCPAGVEFDDLKWHRVEVGRTIKHVSVIVDGQYSSQRSLNSSLAALSTVRLHIGSILNASTNSESARHLASVFSGCLGQVEYSTESLHVNLFELARTGHELVTITGPPLVFSCLSAEHSVTGDVTRNITSDVINIAETPIAAAATYMYQRDQLQDTVSFTRPDANLVLPSWVAADTGSMSFKLRTTEPHGLLLFNSAGSGMDDLFALELVEGDLWLHLNLGSGSARVRATDRSLADGRWHEVAVVRDGNKGRITVDGSTSHFSTPGNNTRLDLEGALYVAGQGADRDLLVIPPQLRSATLRRGFVGCLQALKINGSPAQLSKYARHQSQDGGVVMSCHREEPLCERRRPCFNGGRCSDGWNRFTCDCSATDYTGPTCDIMADVVRFDGTQHMIVPLRRETSTEVDELILRLRTSQADGLLFATTAGNSDRLQLALKSGKPHVTLRMGAVYKSVLVDRQVNDAKWHTLKVWRTKRHVQVWLNNRPLVSEHLDGDESILRVKFFYIGAMSMAGDDEFGAPNFSGELQHLQVNGQSVFDLIERGQLSTNQPDASDDTHASADDIINVDVSNAELPHDSSRPAAHLRAVTFQTRYTFTALTQLLASASLYISLQFRTVESTGLIVFSGREDMHAAATPFVAVELVGGRLHCAFNLGHGVMHVADTGRKTLNDGRWHTVSLQRQRHSRSHRLQVDGRTATVGASSHSTYSLAAVRTTPFTSLLYVGGVPDDMYTRMPEAVQSRYGFKGCLANVTFGGHQPDLVNDPVIPSSSVIAGCAGADERCSEHSCRNGGVCNQHLNSYSCDCSLTSFVGPSCDGASVSYEFGGAGGRVEFVYDKVRRPDRRQDEISLGFSTTSTDGTLVRIDSDTHDDFLELKLIESNVYLLYDVGSQVISVSELESRVDDGKYHVVRATRVGANATLQLDLRPVQYKFPRGHQHDVFHGPSRVSVGGGGDDTSSSHFQGLVSGVTVNGHRVLDTAAAAAVSGGGGSGGGALVAVTGAARARQLPAALVQHYTASYSRQVMVIGSGAEHIARQSDDSHANNVDDLMSVSLEGSGCSGAIYYDKCHAVLSAHATDDLVTPALIGGPDSRAKTEKHVDSVIQADCDEEDCRETTSSGETPEFYDEYDDNYEQDHEEQRSFGVAETDLYDTVTGHQYISTTPPSSTTTTTTHTTTTTRTTARTVFATTTRVETDNIPLWKPAGVDSVTTETRHQVEDDTKRVWSSITRRPWYIQKASTTQTYPTFWEGSHGDNHGHVHVTTGISTDVSSPRWTLPGTDDRQTHSNVGWRPEFFPPPPPQPRPPVATARVPVDSTSGVVFSDDPGEYVAMIIGIVAAVLIVVVLVILVVLKVQARGVGALAYKPAAATVTATSAEIDVDHVKSLPAVAAALQYRAGQTRCAVVVGRGKKVKEWYV